MKAFSTLAFALLAALPLGCGTTGHAVQNPYDAPAADAILQRAPFELGCSKEQVSVSRLGDSWDFGVRGCGKKAVYTTTCANNFGNRACYGATLRSPVMADDAAPATVAPAAAAPVSPPAAPAAAP